MGVDLGTSALIEEAVALGYNRPSLTQAMNWTVGRIALRTGVPHVDDLGEDHVLEALEAVRLFRRRPRLYPHRPR